MTRILLVDDEANVLSSLRRELMQKPDIGHDDVEIETFTSPLEALRRANEGDGDFDVAVVDYRMPLMDGVAFLTAFREIRPDAARIVLSGQADMGALAKAINQAHIDFFVGKPWSAFHLKGMIAQALEHHRLEQENRRLTASLRERAGRAIRLPRKTDYRIMLVDSDKNVLRRLERELMHRSDFDDLYATSRLRAVAGEESDAEAFGFAISSHTSPQQALEAAKNAPPDLVIADYTMHGVDGITFLREFRHVCADTVRMLLSGSASLEVLVEAVNIAGVYHFISKPWDIYELKAAIVLALNYRNMRLENRVLGDLVRRQEKKNGGI